MTNPEQDLKKLLEYLNDNNVSLTELARDTAAGSEEGQEWLAQVLLDLPSVYPINPRQLLAILRGRSTGRGE